MTAADREMTVVRWGAVPGALLLGALVHALSLSLLEGIAAQFVGLNVESPLAQLLFSPLPAFADGAIAVSVGTMAAPSHKPRIAQLMVVAVGLIAFARLFVALAGAQYVMIVRFAFMLLGANVVRQHLPEFLRDPAEALP